MKLEYYHVEDWGNFGIQGTNKTGFSIWHDPDECSDLWPIDADKWPHLSIDFPSLAEAEGA